MYFVPEEIKVIKTISPTKKPSVKQGLTPKEPKGVRVLLSVCSCFAHDRLTLITVPASEVARILHISVSDLELLAIEAMISGKPQLAACYSRDVGETVLMRLQEYRPFIAWGCHRFLIDDQA